MKNSKKLSQSFFKKIFPIIILIGIVCCFFWRFFIQKEIPFPGDFVVGVYYPWLDYKWGYPAGVPVKNPILADVPSFIYPMQTFAIDQLKNHQLPLWNPYILMGTPLLANFQSAPFSPVNIIYFLTDNLTAWSIEIILQHILAAIFTYFLLRHWKVSKSGSLIGGILYAFSGFNLIWSQWNGHVLSASLIPLILLFESKFLTKPKFKYGLGFSISLAIQFLTGYPQIVLYTILAGGLYFFLQLTTNHNKQFILKTFLLGIFGLLAVGLAAFQILPGQELLKYSQRTIEIHPFDWAFLPWSKTITFIAADFFGNHATGNYWGPQDYTSNTGYVTVIGLVLASLAIFLLRKNKNIFYCLLLAITALIFAYPTFVSISLWKSGFLGLNAASAHRSLVLFCLSISLLAGFGIDSLKSLQKKQFTVLLIPFTLIVIFTVYAWTIKQPVGLKNLILPSCALLSITFILIFIYKFRRYYQFAVIVSGIFLIGELFYFGWKFTPFSSSKLIFPDTPIITFLKNQSKPFRVTADKVIPINFLMAYGIETVEGYDAVYPASSSELIQQINQGGAFRRYAIIDNDTSSILDKINTKYYLALTSDKDLKRFDSNRFTKIFQDKSVIIFESKTVKPRAYLENQNTPVSYLSYKENESILKFMSLTSDKLLISDTFFPGWHAYLDENEVAISQSPDGLREIPVTKGTHVLKMIYNPQSFTNGLKISVLSLIIVLLFYLIQKHRLINYHMEN